METFADIEHLRPDALTPPHDPIDAPKLEEITAAMRESGWQGRPLLALRQSATDGVSVQALTGSHRIAAARQAGLQTVPCLVLDHDVWLNLMGSKEYGDGKIPLGSGEQWDRKEGLRWAVTQAKASGSQEVSRFTAALHLIEIEDTARIRRELARDPRYWF